MSVWLYLFLQSTCSMNSDDNSPTSLHSHFSFHLPLPQVHHGKDCGFFVFDSGQGYMEANDIYSNRIAGVEIKSQANPVFYKNLIHHGKTGGVYIHEKVCEEERGGEGRGGKVGEGPVDVRTLRWLCTLRPASSAALLCISIQLKLGHFSFILVPSLVFQLYGM